MSYKQDLDWSNSPKIRAQLEAYYRKKFPNLDRIILVSDLLDQRRGRDALLLMTDGSYVWIDEKIRREKYKTFVEKELLIETRKASSQPGWIEKTQEIDFLVYGCENGPMFRIPWKQLKQAWAKYGEQWKSEYGEIPDADQTSWNCPVPWEELKRAFKEIGNVS